MSALLRIMAMWRGQFGWLAAGAVVSLLALGAGLALMPMSAAMVTGGVMVAGMALRVLGPARVVLRYLERLVSHDAVFRALGDLRVWFFRGLAMRAAGGLGFRQAGDMLARLVNDVEALDGLYLRVVLPLLGAVVLLPAVVWVVWQVHPAAAIAAGVLMATAALVLPWCAALAARGLGQTLTGAAAALRIAALDTLTGLREVRSFGAEGRMLARVQAREAALLQAQHQAARRAALQGAVAFLCGQGAILAVLLAIVLVPSDSMRAVLAVFLVVAGFEAIAGLPRAGVQAGQASAAAARVLAAASGALPVAEPSQPVKLPAGSELGFDAVSFRWQPDRALVLDGLTLEIQQGQRVAVLGPSGAGKSTLAALALRVVDPTHGRVTLGGQDITGIATSDLRRSIAYLSQTTHLFDDSIRANLALGRPYASDAQMWAALEEARIADVVRSLPDGLETWLGEGGIRFSGGQARRLALARALLSQAPVLILDEPCAGLDADTEREFFQALNDAAPGRTVLLICHRLVGVERLDRIWRLSNGRAVTAMG